MNMDLFSRQFAWTDDKLRAVWIFNGELLTLGFQSADDRFYFNINFLYFSCQSIKASHQEEYQSLSACIDNICILQYLKLFRCLGQGFIPAGDGSFQNLAEISFCTDDFPCTLGNSSGYRKDCTLNRFCDRSVCIKYSILECLAHLPAGRSCLAMQSPADSMNNLGQDNAGISSCAHNSAGRRFFRHNADWFTWIHVSNHAVHGLKCIKHVISRISIWYRKYIQLIQNFIFLLEQLICTYQHIFKINTINCSIHNFGPHYLALSKIIPSSPGPRYDARTGVPVVRVTSFSGYNSCSLACRDFPPSSFSICTTPILLQGEFSSKYFTMDAIAFFSVRTLAKTSTSLFGFK